jgi:hypothetical protein
MSPEEAASFLAQGRSILTSQAASMETLNTWSQSFDIRGGQPVYGDDALAIVTFSNDLQAWLTPERAAVIARYRTDV